MIYYSVYSSFFDLPHYYSMNSTYQDDGFGNAIIVNPNMDELLWERMEEDLH